MSAINTTLLAAKTLLEGANLAPFAGFTNVYVQPDNWQSIHDSDWTDDDFPVAILRRSRGFREVVSQQVVGKLLHEWQIHLFVGFGTGRTPNDEIVATYETQAQTLFFPLSRLFATTRRLGVPTSTYTTLTGQRKNGRGEHLYWRAAEFSFRGNYLHGISVQIPVQTIHTL